MSHVYKPGDLAYWIQEVNSDTEDPIVVATPIAHASSKQIMLARPGPSGSKQFVVVDGLPRKQNYGPVPAFHPTAHDAIAVYFARMISAVEQARRNLTSAQRRLGWASEQLP